MKAWQPGLMVEDNDQVRESSNKLERRVTAYLTLTFNLMSHLTMVQQRLERDRPFPTAPPNCQCVVRRIEPEK
jgi:hypothetical protein